MRCVQPLAIALTLLAATPIWQVAKRGTRFSDKRCLRNALALTLGPQSAVSIAALSASHTRRSHLVDDMAAMLDSFGAQLGVYLARAIDAVVPLAILDHLVTALGVGLGDRLILTRRIGRSSRCGLLRAGVRRGE
jgi:hypothetical protein